MFRRVLSTFDAQLVAPVDGSPAAQATSTERGRGATHTGTWVAVLDETDLEAVDRFSIEVPEAAREIHGDLRLEFSRSSGVVLRAGSAEPEQIRGALAALAPVVEPGVPRWAWVHSQVAELIAAVMFGVVVELLWLAVSRHLSDPDVRDFRPLPLGILVGFGVVALLHGRFPRFRVRETGGDRASP
jgi:hypothetical protein